MREGGSEGGSDYEGEREEGVRDEQGTTPSGPVAD